MEALDKKQICKDYTDSNIGIESLALKYHVGKLKIKAILSEAGIPIKKRGNQIHKEHFIVNDWKIEKYPIVEGKHYIAIDKNNGFETLDFNNKAGVLTTHIKKEYDVVVPTLYDRRKYYMRTGNYWWEQWFDIRLVENKQTKKCPYCEWETIDIENKSGAFEQHLLKVHGIDKIEHLKKYPDDRTYFTVVSEQRNRQMSLNQDEYVICKICGKKLAKIDGHHLSVHNMTKYKYISMFGTEALMSERSLEKYRRLALKMNLSNENNPDKFTSKPETEIVDFIQSLGVECYKNRSILNGKELDIYIPSKNIAIEFNGNKWHTEVFGGKDMNYHLDKLTDCENKGIRLIQIFEDEYVQHKDIVLSKISHIIGCNTQKNKIYARKCRIQEIDRYQAKEFLGTNHIQGFCKSTLYLGAFCDGEIVGVMSFLKECDLNWNLTRFATSIKYTCCGIGGKLFKHFIRNYEYTTVKTFADRRWSTSIHDNLYTQLGFTQHSIIKPSYWYYNASIDRYSRIHKFNLRKKTLRKLGNFNSDMTEWEMARELGYDRIWDCGLIKYVYKK